MAEGQELERVEAPEPQKRTAVYRHPDRDMIHALLRRGKSPKWVATWLERRYPLEDEYGTPHPDAVVHRKWHIAAGTIDRYRKEWMPEVEPGVDVIHDKLQNIVGYRPPAPKGQVIELDVMEAAIAVAQHNLAKALDQDEDMGMIQPLTLEANKAMVEASKQRAELAMKLGIDGYAEVAKRVQIEQHSQNANLNVNVDAQVGADGRLRPAEPEKFAVMKQLLTLDPAEARKLVAVAQSEAAQRASLERAEAEAEAELEPPPPPDAEVVEGEAEPESGDPGLPEDLPDEI